MSKKIVANTDIQNQERDKIQKGLEKAYRKMIEHKKSIGGEIVILKDDKVVKIKPE